jgi:hypothetical protein
MSLFDDFHDELQTATWQVIRSHFAPTELEEMPQQFDVRNLLTPPIAEKRARWFLQRHVADKTWQFLSTDQLFDMATSVSGSEIDIDAIPGIYTFVSLNREVVLKVGQTGNLRERICLGHLRYAYQMTESKLIDFCTARWEWPTALRQQEITAILFPMTGSGEHDRRCVECDLHKCYSPEMP